MTSNRVTANRRLAIYGAGGAGREIAWLAETCLGRDAEIVFVVDNEFQHANEINGRLAIPFSQFNATMREVPIVIAVGDSSDRCAIARRCEESGLTFGTLVHPSIKLSPFVTVGSGSILCEGTVLTTNITVGRHVYVNIGSTISHDCVLGDFATLSPGVHLAGWITVGQRVFFGTGACVKNGASHRRLTIADDAVIGAGACVIGDVAAGVTVAGVPARRR